MAVTTPITLPTTRTDLPGRSLPDTSTRWAAVECNATIGAIRERMCWRGPWVITPQYASNDVVTYNNKIYVAFMANVGNVPPGTAWDLLAATSAPVDNEVPVGTVDGVNPTFTLAAVPATGSLHLYLNGVRLRPTTDYTATGSTITMLMIPQVGDWLYADYR
jgi:hypothetical protein